MEESFEDTEEAGEAGTLVQDVYIHLAERRYPTHCPESRKRMIRRKFTLRDGELFHQKQKKKARNGKKVRWS